MWSRKIVDWDAHDHEDDALAAGLLSRMASKIGSLVGLVLHADNGGPMRGGMMLAKMQQLGVMPSFSRPRVSNDNPFSEVAFRTLKYVPFWPDKPFASLEAARVWVAHFVAWYNDEHRHSALDYLTPSERHEGPRRRDPREPQDRLRACTTSQARTLVTRRPQVARRCGGLAQSTSRRPQKGEPRRGIGVTLEAATILTLTVASSGP